MRLFSFAIPFGIGFSAICLTISIVNAAALHECNDKPVKPKDLPLSFTINGCSVGDPSFPPGNAVANAMGELHNYAPLGRWGGQTTSPCSITHGDGQSDVAYVPPGTIDGNLGLTIVETDGCTFSWDEEHIVESDIMALSTLDFSEPDQSLVGTVRTAAGLGRGVVLHESGHAVGLDHTSAFAMMRNGLGARIPYVGGVYGGGSSGNAGHVLYTPDDILGLRNLQGFPGDYPNMYVSAQWRDQANGGDVIRNTDTNQATDQTLSSPFQVCPAQTVSMMVTAGNQSQFSRRTVLRVYADAPGNCSALDGVGTELARFNVRVNGYSTYSFPVTLTVPDGITRGTALRVYSAINVESFPPDEKRGYDDCARSAATIVVPGPLVCGR
jgi:hypothetical protein